MKEEKKVDFKPSDCSKHFQVSPEYRWTFSKAEVAWTADSLFIFLAKVGGDCWNFSFSMEMFEEFCDNEKDSGHLFFREYWFNQFVGADFLTQHNDQWQISQKLISAFVF